MVYDRYETDVLVVGGGMAGVAAAISAARNGMNTLLIDSLTSLGGIATNGLVNGIAGTIEGLCQEFVDKMKAEDAFYPPNIFDPEKAKYVLEQWILETGAAILYGTCAVDVIVEDRTIKEVVVYNKSGKASIEAKVIIDASGDADVAAMAGVPYEVGGREFGGLNQSTTLVFKLSNVNLRKYEDARNEWRTKETVPSKISLITELMEKAVEEGNLPYFIFPTALIYPASSASKEQCEVTVNAAHSFYCRCTDAVDLTRQMVEQRQQIMLLEKFFRKYVPGFENCRLTQIASLLGVRDSRRIIGEYVLTAEDVVCARKFEDGIARFPEFLDTHHPTSSRIGFKRHIHLKEPKEPAVCRPAQCLAEMHPLCSLGGYEARVRPGEYCEIPYRCLIPLKIDNLLVAGRCVSADFDALAAVRVIGTCMSMGQAAGTAAALCIKSGIIPRKLDGKILREKLIEQGVPLNKEPYNRWANIVKNLKSKGEVDYVVTAGDFVTPINR
jgi:hypothetical protein